MEKKEVYFEIEKETKNKKRYSEITDGQPPIIQTIYLPKWYCQGVDKIKITVESIE